MAFLDALSQSIVGSQKRRGAGLETLASLLSEAQAAPQAGPLAAAAERRLSGGVSGRASQGGNVDSWIRSALGVLGLDESYLPGIKNMIVKESSGNPRAVNNWDSNAKRGTPSKGLMQTIDPTFRQWALPGYNQDIFDPVSNIIAGVRYAQNRYGDAMLKSGGRKDARGNYRGY